MKKYIKFIFMFALVIILSFYNKDTAYAETATYENATLILSDFQVVQGDTFTTTLSVAANSNIVDFQIKLNYDTEVLSLVSAAENENVLGDVVANTTQPGVIEISYSRTTSNLTKETPIYDFTFKVDDYVGVGLYDSLTVDTTGIKKADTLLSGVPVKVPLDTDFQQLVIFESGDVDLSQQLDITDATILRRYLVELTELSDFQVKLGDTCYDGTVDITDALYIQRKIVSLKVQYGNRINVNFYDFEGNKCATKSVLFGGNLAKLPEVPAREHYIGGQWSLSPDEYVAPNLNGIEEEISLYAVYGQYQSDAMAYYKKRLSDMYYGGDMPTGLSGNLSLVSKINYQSGYYADIVWKSSNNYVINSTTGAYNKPTYPTKMILTADIVSYDGDGVLECRDEINFEYVVPGKFLTPSKAEIQDWLVKFFEDGVNYDVKLPRRVSNEVVANLQEGAIDTPYEVRIEWSVIAGDGQETPISQIERTTSEQKLDLIATVTFNGEPLEDDGRIYIDEIPVAPITEAEIRAHIIREIAANMGQTLTNGEKLWDDDQVYGSKVKWISSNKDIAMVEDNQVTLNDATVSGTILPLVAEVSYMTEDNAEKAGTFKLNYTMSVVTNNSTLTAGKEISVELYDALKAATDVRGTLTTEALKNVKFVYLDLSQYPEITSLKGLTYCTNLRVLNISGLKIEEGIHEIATLSNLEALIARDCGLDNLSDGGVPILKTAVNLKLLDLSDNNFVNLDSVLDKSVRYGKLSEVYLANNKLVDVSGLMRAPAMHLLVLSGNGLTTEKIARLANYPYLMYLSLADNEIDDITVLQNMRYLKELRLQNNQISDIRALKKLTNLQALYLGNNRINSGVEFLTNMPKLEVLYLNNNRLDSINMLTGLNSLKAINVSGNQLLSLDVLENYASTLEELYAENNSISEFSVVRSMTKLRKLMLAGNHAYEDADLSNYLKPLVELETLTLSDIPVTDLSFLTNMSKLLRLEIENCGVPAYKVTKASVLTDEAGKSTLSVEEYIDNLEAILSRKGTLRFLNISNNPFEYTPDEILAFMVKTGELSSAEGISGVSFTGEIPTAIDQLRGMSRLIAFYADNINKKIDGAKFVQLMAHLQYISMENCGLTSMNWLSRFPNLIYVDLANNNISSVKLSNEAISEQSQRSLKYLYLDTNVESKLSDAYDSFDENVLEELSLKGVTIESIKHLPYMKQLKKLDISNTGLTNLQGDDPDFYDIHSIERFTNLEELNVTGLQADISPLLNLSRLKTVQAVATPEERLFYQGNLHALQNLYNKGVTNYLYDEQTVYAPVAQTEGSAILNLLEDYSCDVTVAAENKISDNNPVLLGMINDYAITWTVSNTTNYEIVDNKLAVKSYENIQDEALTLTASIAVYPNQEPVCRNYTINTKILRPSAENRNIYYNVDMTGFGEVLQREDLFTYNVEMHAGVTEGFAESVKPVADEVKYEYSSVLEDETVTPYLNVIEIDENHQYRVLDTAPINSKTTIKVEIGHNLGGGFVVDDTWDVNFTIQERVYNITYITNGGTVTDANNLSITTQKKAEEAPLFADIMVNRDGYVFDGWYLDAEFNELYWAIGSETVTMPANDMTLYAKWTAQPFNLVFEANGGLVEETTRAVTSDVPFGELPIPTRDYYTFAGWYTHETEGVQITEETSMARTEDIAVYARWNHNAVSDWVQANQLPTDAEVVDRKWSYTETLNMESSDTSVAGYKQIGSYWVQSGTKSVYYSTSFPAGFDTSHSIYTSFAKQPYAAYENATKKRTVSNKWTGYVYWHWMYDSGYGNGTATRHILDEYGYGWQEPKPFVYKYFGAFTDSSGKKYDSDTYYCNGKGILNYIIPERYKYEQCQGATRWFRFSYYTSTYVDYYKMFKYQKIENKESSTAIQASDTISNVQEWVQYRAK